MENKEQPVCGRGRGRGIRKNIEAGLGQPMYTDTRGRGWRRVDKLDNPGQLGQPSAEEELKKEKLPESEASPKLDKTKAAFSQCVGKKCPFGLRNANLQTSSESEDEDADKD